MRSDYVQYTVDPDNITVKRGYADPVKVDQEYEADKTGRPRCWTPKACSWTRRKMSGSMRKMGTSVWSTAMWTPMTATMWWYSEGSDRLLSVYTDVDEEQLVLTEMDPSWQGKRFYAKVKALGSVYDSTEDSEFGDK